MSSLVIIVMGVSASGKTSLCEELTALIRHKICAKCDVITMDADDFHPQENKQLMASGVALTDANRQPWLHALRHELETQSVIEPVSDSKDSSNVIHRVILLACSALKRSYRDILRGRVSTSDSDHCNSTKMLLRFVFLDGDMETIQRRMKARTDHFMPVSLLQSQFDALQRPNNANIEPDIITLKIGDMKDVNATAIAACRALETSLSEHGAASTLLNRLTREQDTIENGAEAEADDEADDEDENNDDDEDEDEVEVCFLD
jgi:gluconokinase